jgi:hypothetical protein
VAAGQGGPPVPDIADYRPGGAVQASGVAYRAIPASACSNGVWTPGPKEKLTGVVYVPCGVSLTGQDTVPATIAAEGPIAVRGSGVVVGPTTAGAPSLITADTSASAVSLKGSGLTVRGTVFAPAGTVSASGSGFVAQCGIVASAIEITGSGGSATLGARCLG